MRVTPLRLRYFSATGAGPLLPIDHVAMAGKFVVVEVSDGLLVLFGPPLTPSWVHYHADLIRAAGEPILEVRGGGHFTQKQGIWRLYGRSEQFGSCTPALRRRVHVALRKLN